jgi:hypothetical protein
MILQRLVLFGVFLTSDHVLSRQSAPDIVFVCPYQFSGQYSVTRFGGLPGPLVEIISSFANRI